MNMKQLPRKTLLALVLAGSFTAAHATNGYFAHGYGIKAKGMGGASVAMTHDAFAGANNPAAAAFAGNRWDLGAEIFSPRRSYERTGANADEVTPANDRTILNGSVDSDKNYFLVPEFGYNVQHSDKIGLNLTVYGNGGMNTEYPASESISSFPNAFFDAGNNEKLGVDLMQLIIAPTIAYKFSDKSAIGISPLIVFQRFKAYGLQGFTEDEPTLQSPQFSSYPNNLTDKGYSSSTGIGVRLGYMAKLNDQVAFGASYAPKINMGKFDKYKGLFAEAGDFDIPENYTIGLAIQATPTIQVAMDYQRINYSGVASIGNSSDNVYGVFDGDPESRLGGLEGPGFGWKDINVIKLGIQWQASPTWTLRAGYNRGDNPIKSTDVTFNILAPGVIKDHFTLGGTMAIDKQSELSLFYMHARKNSVTGPNLFGFPVNSGGIGSDTEETISMYQNSIGIQYSKKF
jgi:long-chain fatty acid transport protein